MNTRKSLAGLALLLSFLIAIPPVVLADDTELFTTSANPNVLLMLDTTGSMSDSASGTSVGDLDGDGNSNTKMDILWKVVYTLLNANLSQPSYVVNDTVTVTCELNNARQWNKSTIDTKIKSNKTYQYVEVNSCAVAPSSVSSDPWNLFSGFDHLGRDRDHRVRGTIGKYDVRDKKCVISRPIQFYQREVLLQKLQPGFVDCLLLQHIQIGSVPAKFSDKPHGSHELRFPEQPHRGRR